MQLLAPVARHPAREDGGAIVSDKLRYETHIARDMLRLSVFLGKRRIGTIVELQGGYQYRPKGSSLSGDVFPTLASCKMSLEVQS